MAFKADLHKMFEFASAFQKNVKFLSSSCKRKCYARTTQLVATDTILENSKAGITCEQSFKLLNQFKNQVSENTPQTI